VASVVSAMAVANAAMQRPKPAPPKAKKARKWSTSCALLTLPSLLQRQHLCMPKWLSSPKRPLRPWLRRLLLLLWWRKPHQWLLHQRLPLWQHQWQL